MSHKNHVVNCGGMYAACTRYRIEDMVKAVLAGVPEDAAKAEFLRSRAVDPTDFHGVSLDVREFWHIRIDGYFARQGVVAVRLDFGDTMSAVDALVHPVDPIDDFYYADLQSFVARIPALAMSGGRHTWDEVALFAKVRFSDDVFRHHHNNCIALPSLREIDKLRKLPRHEVYGLMEGV